MSDFECDSLLIYGTDFPIQSDDINKDLKRIIYHTRVGLVKQSHIVLPELVTHIIAGYMLSGAQKLGNKKRKLKSVRDDDDDQEQLFNQINRFLAHSSNGKMKLGQCQTCPDGFPEDSTLYLTYVLPHRFSLSKLQSIDTSQYKTVCEVLGIQSQRSGPELFCLTNYPDTSSCPY